MRNTVEEAVAQLTECFLTGGKLLLCGNGGSASDCAHIAGEFGKSFLLRRQPGLALTAAVGEAWASNLQEGLPAIDLTSHTSLMTAIANDIGGEFIFAQQVMAFGRKGDVLMGLSTSGNAENVRRAMLVARARGMAQLAKDAGLGRESLYKALTPGAKPRYDTVLA